MVESTTQHYGWTKPEVTKSASTWGGFLNTDLDSIDALVFANQQGIVPIGSITMFGGATAPAGWLICDGRSLDTTAYAALFAVLQYAHGGSGPNFNLPNLTQKFPIGAGTTALGGVGGASSVALATANLPPHAHPIVDVAHGHTATQPAHVHPDPGHTHGASETAAHVHGGSLMRFLGGSGQPLGITGGGNANVNYGNTDPASSTITVAAAATNLQAAGNDAITVTASGTGLSTTQNAGSGTPVPLPLPPFVSLNFIVRAF